MARAVSHGFPTESGNASVGMPTLPLLSAGSLEVYLQTIGRIPILEAAQEADLAHRAHDQHDAEAAQTLVLSHLRFVVYIARGFLDYGLPFSDLIQQGNVGLLRAVSRFNPAFGVRLISFSVHWIKSEIHEFVLKNWRIVKMATTHAQRKLFFGLRSRKKSAGRLSPAEAAAIAADLKVTATEVMSMEARFSAFDAPIDNGGTDDTARFEPAEPSDGVATLAQAEWDAHRSQCLKAALSKLDARSLDIVKRRWLCEGKPAGLEELAAIYAVSAERVRQIQNKALQRLRAELDDARYEHDLDFDQITAGPAYA